MATKIEVLNDPTYDQYIMIGMIQVARDVIVEPSSTVRANVRKDFAKEILRNPFTSIPVFKALCVVNFDTTLWTTFTETQKITGAKGLVAAVFNEAGNIYQ